MRRPMSQSCKQDIIKGVGIVTPFLAAAPSSMPQTMRGPTVDHQSTAAPLARAVGAALQPPTRPPLIRGSIGSEAVEELENWQAVRRRVDRNRMKWGRGKREEIEKQKTTTTNHKGGREGEKSERRRPSVRRGAGP